MDLFSCVAISSISFGTGKRIVRWCAPGAGLYIEFRLCVGTRLAKRGGKLSGELGAGVN